MTANGIYLTASNDSKYAGLATNPNASTTRTWDILPTGANTYHIVANGLYLTATNPSTYAGLNSQVVSDPATSSDWEITKV